MNMCIINSCLLYLFSVISAVQITYLGLNWSATEDVSESRSDWTDDADEAEPDNSGNTGTEPWAHESVIAASGSGYKKRNKEFLSCELIFCHNWLT